MLGLQQHMIPIPTALPVRQPPQLSANASKHTKAKCKGRTSHISHAGATLEKETSTAAESPDASRQQEVSIPAEVRNSVVQLQAPNPDAPGGETQVYILGMSHVSRESVQAVRTLISAVRPEVVLVELCKDRVGLMLNPEGPKGAQLWNSRRVSITGLPSEPGWPQEAQALSVVSSQPGVAFTTPDVEVDCVKLLATGLFRNVRPSFKRPTALDGPQFVRVLGERLATVPPLGPVEFIVTPRVLPPPTNFSVRIDSSLAQAGVQLPEQGIKDIRHTLLSECNPSILEPDTPTTAEDPSPAFDPVGMNKSEKEGEEQPSEAEEKPVEAAKKPDAALDGLLRARAALEGLLEPQLHGGFIVSLNGVESGEIEAVVRARAPGDEGFRTGLEASAEGGEGYGIETFKPQRGPLQISKNLKIPNIARVIQRMGENASDFVLPVPSPSHDQRRPLRQWTADEKQTAEAIGEETVPDNLGTKFAEALSQAYGFLQVKAGETVGLTPGAAWREALEAASENGGRQVHLGDMPADLAARNLADGIWRGLSLRVQVAAVVTTLALTAAVTHILPSGTDGAASGAVAVSLAAAVLPFLGPLLEIYLFSRKSAEAIEDTVRIKEPLQARGEQMMRLDGEDAIVGWPNAKETIIDQRDVYMARTLYAAATGRAASPAFVLDTSGDRHAWQYAMPEGAPDGCSTLGAGLGAYKGVAGSRAVVAVVGSAHVGGIVREWRQAKDLDQLSQLLKPQTGNSS